MIGKATPGGSGSGGGSMGNGGIGGSRHRRRHRPPRRCRPPPPPVPRTAGSAAAVAAIAAAATAAVAAAAIAAATVAAAAAGHEARAQEPIIREVTGVKSAPEQVVVESAGAQFASTQGESAGSRRRASVRLHHQNAVRDRLRARAGRVADIEFRRACSRAAVNDQPIRRRAVVAEKGVELDRSAHACVVHRGQGLVARELRRIPGRRSVDDLAGVVGDRGGVRIAGHRPDGPLRQVHRAGAAESASRSPLARSTPAR